MSVVQSDCLISEYLITDPLANRVYPEWRDIQVNREKFITEVVNTTKNFINDLSQINSLLSKSQRIVQLQSLLEKTRR